MPQKLKTELSSLSEKRITFFASLALGSLCEFWYVRILASALSMDMRFLLPI
jgi:hypothetical protein